ncbi:response regulator transcription factor [Gracilimonas sp.]|uniref:response regulator transcription factor n=1 Tax=Gracilimonas sp. TaxID=1974203 RepID=UPI003BAB4D22
MKELKVLILDDEMVIARDLERILRGMGITKIRIANNAEDAISSAKRFLPNLFLSDVNLDDNETDGIDVTKSIAKFLCVQVIYITAHSGTQILKRAKESRPVNYIVKPFEEEQIKVAVELVANGPEIQHTGLLKSEDVQSLTVSEKRILRLISENKTTKEIAKQLFVSPKTVENHRGNITRKLGIKSRNNSLLTWAIAHKNQL